MPRSRTVILALACLGHVGLFLLLAHVIGGRWPTPVREPEPLRLSLIDSLARPDPPPPDDAPPPVLTPPSEVFAGPVPDIDMNGAALSPPVSDSVPRVDWIDERRREVANVVTREAAEDTRLRVGAQAGGMNPPHEDAEHAADVVGHSGETKAPRSCNRARAAAQAGPSDSRCRRAK